MRSRASFILGSLAALIATTGVVRPALGCTACFGDPDSPLTHGARQGILIMVVITYGLLFGLALMFTVVVVRARRGRADQDTSQA